MLHGAAPGDRRGRQATACSRAAGARGVRVGMSLAEATALWERGAKGSGKKHPPAILQTLPHDRQADGEALDRLAAWCDRYSPLVGRQIEDNDALLWLDAAGVEKLFGGDRPLAQRLEEDLAKRGYTARAAVADTCGAAWACARFTDWRAAPQGPILDWLKQLPVAALRLLPAAAEMLRRLGIAKIEELLNLPRSHLAARLPRAAGRSQSSPGGQGSLVLWRLDQATGEIDEPITPYRPPAKFQAELAFDDPLESRQAVSWAARSLIEQLSQSLRAAGRGAVRLVCRFDCAARDSRKGGGPVEIEAALFAPSACFDHLLELVEMQMEQLALAGPVGRMRVSAPLTAALEERQGEWFAEGGRDSGRHMARLVDRLSGRLGRENVLRASLEPDAQPELAYLLQPLTGEGGGQRTGEKGRGSPSGKSSSPDRAVLGPAHRPLWMLSPPAPVQVMSLGPQGPLAHFFHRGRLRKAVRCWGPERIETGWWRGPSVRRDYYRLETESGHWYWLFCDLQNGGWFLHGAFE